MTTIFIDDTDSTLTYIGGWGSAGSSSEYNRSVACFLYRVAEFDEHLSTTHFAGSTGQAFAFTFNGV